ncbi:unnamed protein product [Merluccius merluccius]
METPSDPEQPLRNHPDSVKYVRWSHTYLFTLTGKLPELTRGGRRWVGNFEGQTAGQKLALGDIKAC